MKGHTSLPFQTLYAEKRIVYDQRLRENLQTLENTKTFLRYPSLATLLNAYGASKRNRLRQLHNYFLTYDTMPSYHPRRGIEMMASQDALVKRFGGCKATWSACLKTFCALGLLRMYRPRQGKTRNTQAQDKSAERACAHHQRSVIWYSIPFYTDKILSVAENRAPSVKRMGRGINKDAVRDVYGQKQANRLFDSGWDEGERTTFYRQQLREALKEQLSRRGYGTKDDILRAVQRNTHSSFLSGEIERIYTAYQPKLFVELHVTGHRPKREEIERFDLPNKQWIIR